MILKQYIRIVILMMTIIGSPLAAQENLRIGYTPEWPLPAQFGISSGAYDEALDMPVSWISYDNSADLSKALASGEIQIILSQGVIPFLLLARNNPDIRIIDISVSYPESQNCILRNGVTVATIKTAALPLGTIVHFELLDFFKQQNIDPSTITLKDNSLANAASAVKNGTVDIACGWGPALDTMSDFGTPLFTDNTFPFEVILAHNDFASQNAKTIARLLKVTNELNASFSRTPTSMMKRIAETAQMTEPATADTMQKFVFPSVTEKLSDAWLAQNVAIYLNNLVLFFATQGISVSPVSDFTMLIDLQYLKAASELPLID